MHSRRARRVPGREPKPSTLQRAHGTFSPAARAPESATAASPVLADRTGGPPLKREIRGFHRDAEGHWVAELSCGHGQHQRHDPPWTERPWVLDPRERRARLGVELECRRCDRRELPDAFEPYRRTPLFSESTAPAALQRRHTTRAGVWARIHVEAGALEYQIHEPYGIRERLDPEHPGTVPPEVEHEVAPLGTVRFYVEFWRRASESGT